MRAINLAPFGKGVTSNLGGDLLRLLP
jgi:hypothetical protein